MSGSTTRRNVLIGGVGLACSGLAWAGARETAVPPLPDGALEKMVPHQLGPWRYLTNNGVIVPAESELSERVYNDTLVRVYTNDETGAAVAFLLAYGSFQGRDMQLHRPEVCYPAAGFAIEGARTLDLDLPGEPRISAKLLETASQSRPEQVLYWTRIGREFPTTPLQQRWAVLSQNFEGSVPDGILVRMSTVAADGDEALPVLRGFTADMLQAAPASMLRLVVGQA